MAHRIHDSCFSPSRRQCVPSVICAQIYHSKLVITDAGSMTTPGRKVVIPSVPRRRLTGIIVSRSIDELLHMEAKTVEKAHFIQYKVSDLRLILSHA
jgi:hypothetical protein